MKIGDRHKGRGAGHKIDTVIFNEVQLTLVFFDGETIITKKLGIIG
jgi:hypothetical protein